MYDEAKTSIEIHLHPHTSTAMLRKSSLLFSFEAGRNTCNLVSNKLAPVAVLAAMIYCTTAFHAVAYSQADDASDCTPLQGQGYEIPGFVWWQGHTDPIAALSGRNERNLIHLITHNAETCYEVEHALATAMMELLRESANKDE